MNRFRSHILIYSDAAYNWAKQFNAEDSKIITKEFNERVIYIDTAVKKLNIFNFEILKLGCAFYYDNGNSLEIVTANNYKNYDIENILILLTSYMAY